MLTSYFHSLLTNKSIHRRLITLSIMLLACYISLWRIEALPSAIHSDEAVEGIDAAKILYQGARPIFLEENNGRQPLFAYMVAVMLWLFGPTPPAIRLVAGIAVIGIVYGAIKTADTIFGPRIGWLTGLIAATTILTIRIGRLGTRVSIFPMFLNLAVWQVAVAIKTGRLRHWIVAGVLLASRITPTCQVCSSQSQSLQSSPWVSSFVSLKPFATGAAYWRVIS